MSYRDMTKNVFLTFNGLKIARACDIVTQEIVWVTPIFGNAKIFLWESDTEWLSDAFVSHYSISWIVDYLGMFDHSVFQE